MARGRRSSTRRLTIIAVGARGEIEKSDLDRRATLRVLFRSRVCIARLPRWMGFFETFRRFDTRSRRGERKDGWP